MKDSHVFQNRRSVVRDNDLALGRLDLYTTRPARGGRVSWRRGGSSRKERERRPYHLVHSLGTKRRSDGVTDGLCRVHVRQSDLHGLALREAGGSREVSLLAGVLERARELISLRSSACPQTRPQRKTRTLSLNWVLPTFDAPSADDMARRAGEEKVGREREKRVRERSETTGPQKVEGARSSPRPVPQHSTENPALAPSDQPALLMQPEHRP